MKNAHRPMPHGPPKWPDLIPTWTYSFSHYHYLKEAVAKRAFYGYGPSGPGLLHRVRRYNSVYAEFRLVPLGQSPQTRLSDEEKEAQSKTLLSLRNRLTDLDVDVLDILIATWLDRKQSPESYVEIDTDEILYARGMKHKVNGQASNEHALGRGYHPKQRESVNRALFRLTLLWGDVKVIHPHDAEPFNEESRVLEVDRPKNNPFKSLGEKSNAEITLSDRLTFSYRPGQLLRRFNLRQRMYLPPEIYRYNYRKHVWEKRLSRYLYWQWRIHKNRGDTLLKKSPGTFLDSILVDVDEKRFLRREEEKTTDINPRYRSDGKDISSRTRFRLEKALDTLASDGLIEDWEYLEGWDSSWSQKSNWGRLWMNADVAVCPPERLRSKYNPETAHGRDSRSPALDPDVDPLDSLRTLYEQNGLVQNEIAEELDISQGYVSALLNDRANPSRALTRKIHLWLRRNNGS